MLYIFCNFYLVPAGALVPGAETPGAPGATTPTTGGGGAGQPATPGGAPGQPAVPSKSMRKIFHVEHSNILIHYPFFSR